ncbi:MAG: gliding-motility associated ABC transporter substrate-binding component GldG [Bacteroidetes bacterium]|nr:MAG: gliding-motility associated ABC transporter substrate-binding component GldG [Bacteroidota bacterium]
MSKSTNKRRDLLRLLAGVIIVIMLNVLSSFLFTRFDLTAEKRYTLSEGTRRMLEDLDDVVYFKVYLDADFPQGAGDLKHLRDEVRIMLDEFRAYAGDNVQYEFIDPSDNKDRKQREALYNQLEKKGLRFINPRLTADEGGGVTRQKFFPGALAIYRTQETPIQLYFTPTDQVIPTDVNKAVEKLEYELTNAIRKLQMNRKQKVAFIQGHGELDSLYTADFAKALREYYTVSYQQIGGQLNALRDTIQKADQIRNKYDAIIFARPLERIDEKDKFIIDQFIMYGGKVLWLLEPMEINYDSLAQRGSTMGLNDSTDVDDLLFRYGARVNNDLVLDMQCQYIPINMAPPGAQPQIEPRNWVYWPLVQPTDKHPIVKGLDLLKFNYAGTVDTLETKAGIRKTILLRSSKYSRIVKSPARIDLRTAFMQVNERMFDKSGLPMAVLLEGNFESAFKNRIPPKIASSREIGFKEKSKETAMIIFGDGEIVANNYRNGIMESMGYDRLSEYTFANKELLLNCMNYLCDDEGMMSLRSRELSMRLLDKKKVAASRLNLQLFNNLLPVGIIIFFGIIAFYVRRRKYGRKTTAA